MRFLEILRDKDPSGAMAYHLEGLLEAQNNIQSLLEKLDPVSTEAESYAKDLVGLQLEIYTHLAYHMKELRRPLKRLIDSIHNKLPDYGVDEGIEELTRLIRPAK